MTRRLSARARAREVYGAMAEKLAPQGDAEPLAPAGAATPLPDPLPQGEREPAEQGARAEQASAVRPALAPPDLTTRIRDLYEASAVPVREVARIAGVSERTLYKYVAKGGWKRRYDVLPRGEAAAAANRGRHWKASHARQGNAGSDIAPAKGAGGRFIRREDIGQPYPAGLKALDPAGRSKALAACGTARRLSRAAQQKAGIESARALLMRDVDARVAAIRDMIRYLSEMQKTEALLRKRELALKRRQDEVSENPPTDEMRAELARRIENMLAQRRDSEEQRAGLGGGVPASDGEAGAAPPAPSPAAPHRFDPDDYRNYPRPGCSPQS